MCSRSVRADAWRWSWWVAVQDKLTTETKDTPLQEKLDDMANFIG